MDEEALIRKAADLLETAEKVIDELRSRRPEDDIAGAAADIEPPSLVEKVAIAQFVAQVAAAERLIARDEEIRQAGARVAESALKEVQEQARQRLMALKVPRSAPQAMPPADEEMVGIGQLPLVTVLKTDEGLEVDVLAGENHVFFHCLTPQELAEAFRKTADLLAASVLSKNS